MITARSADVDMPPGKYQIATVLKGKINNGGWYKGKPRRPYKPTRKDSRKERMIRLNRIVRMADEKDEYIRRYSEHVA